MSAKPDETGIHQWLHVDQFPEQLKKYGTANETSITRS
jgi:hypothetical protein